MDNLLDMLEWDGNNYKDVRARTILLLLYETGLRRSELVGLDDAVNNINIIEYFFINK